MGVQASQDVKRSARARSLKEEIAWIKTENRRWRNRQATERESHLSEGLAARGSRRIESNTVLGLDLRDRRQAFAKKREYRAQVRDGSTGEGQDG